MAGFSVTSIEPSTREIPPESHPMQDPSNIPQDRPEGQQISPIRLRPQWVQIRLDQGVRAQIFKESGLKICVYHGFWDLVPLKNVWTLCASLEPNSSRKMLWKGPLSTWSRKHRGPRRNWRSKAAVHLAFCLVAPTVDAINPA